MDNNKIIPVVFSTDDNYAMPTAVAIHSLLNANTSINNWLFVILYKGILNDESKTCIIDATQKSHFHIKSEVRFIDIKDGIEYTYLRIQHISAPTYYRLLLPQILPEFDKCLYMDGDILVRRDISALLHADLSDNEYIGAVRCPYMAISKPSTVVKHKNELGIPTLKYYFNAGVILMNLKVMREKHLSEKMLDLIKCNFPIQDQDILNKVCFEHIKLFSPIYNCTPALFDFPMPVLIAIYGIRSVCDARKNSVIIHYANQYKPWGYTGLPYSSVWDSEFESLFNRKLTGRTKHESQSLLKKAIKRVLNRKTGNK